MNLNSQQAMIAIMVVLLVDILIWFLPIGSILLVACVFSKEVREFVISALQKLNEQ